MTFDDARIRKAIEETNAKLLVLDPLSSYIGNCSMNAANEVRPALNHLIQTAKETGWAIVIVNHLNKRYGTKAIYLSHSRFD